MDNQKLRNIDENTETYLQLSFALCGQIESLVFRHLVRQLWWNAFRLSREAPLDSITWGELCSFSSPAVSRNGVCNTWHPQRYESITRNASYRVKVSVKDFTDNYFLHQFRSIVFNVSIRSRHQTQQVAHIFSTRRRLLSEESSTQSSRVLAKHAHRLPIEFHSIRKQFNLCLAWITKFEMRQSSSGADEISQ